tara:strand:- start:7201 stop:7461 length:261 start_codon:yes stop_codon:yes gene_type:complete
MVLGFIVYEAVDVVYNVGKIGYNSVTGLYNWYYSVETPEVIERRKEMDKIEELENKIDKLSKMFNEGNLKEKIDQLNLNKKLEDKH